jgi:hypothetical protein
MDLDQASVEYLVQELMAARSALRCQDQHTRTDEVLLEVIESLVAFLKANQP